jgi:hypothetical protein
MRTVQIFAVPTLSILSACNNALISAEPLAVTPADLVIAENSKNKRNYLGGIVYDSEQKCTAFLNDLVKNESSVNTIGDIISGALSGTAAFVTPIATSHILAGTAAIVTGAKSAINSDFYAKASTANFETAIQQSYFKNIGQYVSDLGNQADSNIIVALEVSKIQTIHSGCGVGPAEAAIQATIAPQGGTPGGGAPGAHGAPPPPAPAIGGRGVSATQGAVPGSPLR